jgi:hypothetical protein
MVSQERKPAFRWVGVSGRFAHPAGDGSLGNDGTPFDAGLGTAGGGNSSDKTKAG